MRRFIPIVIVAIAVVALGQSRLFPAPSDSASNNSGQTAAAAPGPEAPHSPAAIEAKRKYDLTVKLAKEAYRKALVAADKDYIDVLAKAEDAALKGGLSDKPEADRLDAARLAAVDKMHDDQAGTTDITPDLKITNAVWGVPDKHADVTTKVKIKGNELSFDGADLGDPDPGVWKSLHITGEINEVPFSIALHDLGGLGHFTFQYANQ